MSYFLRRLLALSIVTSLFGIAMLAGATAQTVHAAVTLLEIGISMSVVGLLLTIGQDVVAGWGEPCARKVARLWWGRRHNRR